MLLSCMGKPKVKTMSKGKSPKRTQSGKRILERCTEKGKTKNVVIINVDNGKAPDVILIDVPESSKKKARTSRLSPQKSPSVNIISLDDDDDDDEINAEEASESGGGHDSTATISKSYCPAFGQSKDSEESDYEDCQIIRERKFPLTFSKRKRTYSEETFSKNRFGLSDSSSSDSDNSDCEFMEGSSGKIREQWERAAMKKKMFDNQVPASSSDLSENVEEENRTNQNVEKQPCSTSKSANDEKVNPSTCTSNDDDIVGDHFVESKEDDPVVEIQSCSTFKNTNHEKVNPSTCTSNSGGILGGCLGETEGDPVVEIPFCCTSKIANDEKVNPSTCTSNCDDIFRDRVGKTEEDDPVVDLGRAVNKDSPSCCSGPTQTEAQFYMKDGETLFGEPISSDPDMQNNTGDINCEPSHQANGESGCQANKETVYYAEPCWLNTDSYFNNDEASYHNDDDTFMEENEPFSKECFACTSPLQSENEITHETVSCHDKEKSPPGEPSLSSTQVNYEKACFKDGQDLAMQLQCDTEPVKSPPSHDQDGNVTHDDQNDIIGERERFKETVEFKRAAEEEWASRQRQLQIQAEEAQRLRKRIKAEALRMKDMERRQKQRVEEVRETQKKNVEIINLKEQLRAEVRRELVIMEIIHTDMASLLRGLGIQVSGGYFPTSREVHAAYKQALLKFHPDRASKTDIRQQVEAEEKFKLISRLKEKLLPI